MPGILAPSNWWGLSSRETPIYGEGHRGGTDTGTKVGPRERVLFLEGPVGNGNR